MKDLRILAVKEAMMEQDDTACCWICLESHPPLVTPCKCPRLVHSACLAQWQLSQVSRDEELVCRFCNTPLEDWKPHVVPPDLKGRVNNVTPIVMVCYDGRVNWIPIEQGNSEHFTQIIRDMYGFDENTVVSLTFTCKNPLNDQLVSLTGNRAFDAALHCSRVCCAARKRERADVTKQERRRWKWRWWRCCESVL